MSKDDSESLKFRAVFRGLFQEIIGETGVRVLEYHFMRLSSSDMYDLLSKDPGKFYRILTRFFGGGAKSFLKIIAAELITRFEIYDISIDELTSILMGERGGSRERLRELVARIHPGEGR